MKPSLLILAAGIGSRYGSLKQIDKFGPSGESLIDYSLFDALKAGFQKATFIINKSMEKEFQEILEKGSRRKSKFNMFSRRSKMFVREFRSQPSEKNRGEPLRL